VAMHLARLNVPYTDNIDPYNDIYPWVEHRYRCIKLERNVGDRFVNIDSHWDEVTGMGDFRTPLL